jgi:hypothetical protein
MRSKKFFPLFIICILIVFSNLVYGQTEPVLSDIESTPLDYTEGDPAAIITSTITVTDPDDTNLDSAIIRIAENYLEDEDELDFTNTFFITGDWDPETGILKLTGSTTIARYQTALRNVRYENTNTDNPSTDTRTVTFKVHDGDNYSDSVQRDITVTGVNDAPVLSPIETLAISFTEGGTPVNLTSVIAVTDVDDDNMESATIQITSGYQSTEDILSFTPVGGITGVWYPGIGTLSLSGTSSKSNYNTALRSVTYQNTSEDPTTSTRTVTFRVNDGDANSNIRTRNINITAINDPPVLSDIETTPLGYSEGGPPAVITSSIVVTDVDDDNMVSATIQITSNYLNGEDILSFTSIYNITGLWNSGQGRLTLSGTDTKAHYQQALRSVRYSNTNTEDPSTLTRTVTFRINDGSANSNYQTRNITISTDNDPPVLSGIETAPLSYSEGDGAVEVTSTIEVEDVDDTNIESAIIRITGNYQMTEDRLRFTSMYNISGSWNVFYGRLTLSGSDTKAHYQAALRSVAYENIDLTNPSTLTRTISFTINDGDDNSNTETRDIDFIELNDPPELSGIESTSLSYTEGDPPAILTSTIIITDIDDDNMESAAIRITSGYVITEDSLSFTSVGGISGEWDLGTGTLSLSGISSKTNYTTALRSVRYQNTSEDPSTITRTATFTVFDGEDLSNPQSRNINVSGVNDPPVASNVNISGNFVVNSSLTGSYDYEDLENDPEGSSTYTWYQAEYPDGTDSVEISGATSINYITKSTDGGKYLSFGVKPRDNKGATSPFIFNSDWEYINARPVVLNLSIAGAKAINQTDTASFEYFDLEDDPENPANHYYQWYRADNPSGHNKVVIPGANNRTYTITNNDRGKYIAVEVSLAASSGSLRGDTAQSIWYGPITQLPSVTISGTTAICPGGQAEITFSYIGENPPWSVTYTIDGTDEYTISNIDEDERILETDIPGVYELVSVSDNRFKNVKISGSVIISLYEGPTVELSGIVTEICGDGTGVGILQADFTGEAPWNITLDRPGANDTIYTNITQDPFNMNVLDAGTYRISALSDANCSGDTTGSGSVRINIIEIPPVSILGLQQAYSVQDDPVPIYGDPPGGTFSGPGIITGIDPVLFSPGYAGITEEDDDPHQIVYTYRFPSGCYGRDTVYVRVLSSTASIVFPDNKTFYCYNDNPFIVEGFNIFKNPGDASMVIGEFSISGEGIGLVDNGNNTATVYPEILQDGIFTITYSKSNGNSFEETEQFQVQYVDEIYIIGFTDHEYCSNDENVKLNGNMSEGAFYGNLVTETPGGFYFVPSYATAAGVDTIFYSYTTPQGCTRVTSDTVQVDMSPAIEFLADDLCIAVGTNDSTEFINNTTSIDSVVRWFWNFGDVSSGTENTSTLKNPKHVYTKYGGRIVTLTAETNLGCIATKENFINFGDVPVADFKWESECFHSGIPIQFTNTSTSNEGIISSTKWKFYSGENYTLSFNPNPSRIYPEYGDYDVELVAETEYGCADTIFKTLHLRKTEIIEQGYFEDFEQGVSGWFPDYINNSTFYTNSWTYGEPEGGFSGSASGVNAWYTNIESESPSEKSWVKSPCFDFSNTIRPIVKLNIWRLFDQTRDGAVLQYTTDNSETWHNVGGYKDGINWYNRFNIPIQPGDNSVGWSDIKDSKWIEARHKLDNLRGKTNVQFRIAYASEGAAINNDGIAFDNIWIGENKKTVLIEHFTNTLDSKCKEADFILNNIVNSSNDAIDIQYHTSFPEGDPFYLHNPSASGTREGYYGLSSFPYSMMDGGFTNAHKFDYELKTIEMAVIDTQTLKDPLFDLQLNTENTGSSIDIECSLTALSDIPESYITLYIVVVEREITQITEENEEEIYESVVKKMLPTPSGTSYFNKSWTAGESANVNYSWTFVNVFDAEEIRVVAFVQNENTGEIYQTAIDKRDWLPTNNNGIYISQPTKIIVFPNPTSGITYIKFNQPVNEKCRLELFNNIGKLLYSDEIYKGEELVHFDTKDLNNGLYILRIADKKRVIDVKKLIISR